MCSEEIVVPEKASEHDLESSVTSAEEGDIDEGNSVADTTSRIGKPLLSVSIPDTPLRKLSKVVFTGTGGMYVYSLGVAKYLQETYDLSTVEVIATSGGTAAGLALTAGICCRRFLEEIILPGLEQCAKRASGVFMGGMDHGRQAMKVFLDRHENVLEDVGSRLKISCTQADIKLSNRILSSDIFRSQEDLLDAVAASAFIPWLFGKRPATKFQGHWYMDGGISELIQSSVGFARRKALEASKRGGLIGSTVSLLDRVCGCRVTGLNITTDTPPPSSEQQDDAVNEDDADDAVSDDDRGEEVYIAPWNWRIPKVTWFWPWCDPEWNREMFLMGYADAKEHMPTNTPRPRPHLF